MKAELRSVLANQVIELDNAIVLRIVVNTSEAQGEVERLLLLNENRTELLLWES